MIKQGVGRRSWRAEYPSDEWDYRKRQQLANGDRILLLKEFSGNHAAVMTFFHKDNDLHWILHYDGSLLGAEKTYEGIVLMSQPPADYSEVPNFGRF